MPNISMIQEKALAFRVGSSSRRCIAGIRNVIFPYAPKVGCFPQSSFLHGLVMLRDGRQSNPFEAGENPWHPRTDAGRSRLPDHAFIAMVKLLCRSNGPLDLAGVFRARHCDRKGVLALNIGYLRTLPK